MDDRGRVLSPPSLNTVQRTARDVLLGPSDLGVLAPPLGALERYYRPQIIHVLSRREGRALWEGRSGVRVAVAASSLARSS